MAGVKQSIFPENQKYEAIQFVPSISTYNDAGLLHVVEVKVKEAKSKIQHFFDVEILVLDKAVVRN